MELKFDKEKGKFVRVGSSDKKKVDNLVGTEEPIQITTEMLKPYIFSERFRIMEFDEKTLKKELPISRRNRDVSVDVYIDFMKDYLNRLKQGRKPNKSYILSAPDGFGKKIFAYQVIKEALAHKLEVTPILQSQDLYSLLDKHKYEEFYANFKGKDIAIITFGGAPTMKDPIVVKTVLEHCERHDVAVLLLSRFEPEMFSRWDSFSKLYLGVNVSKKGDFGVAESKGFNKEQMQAFREEISGYEKNFAEEKRAYRR